MTFQEQLNSYIDTISCTLTELSDASGISVSVISRYRSGKRVPVSGSTQLTQLADGLTQLAEKKGISGFASRTVYETLERTLDPQNILPPSFAGKLNSLINALHISLSDLSRALNYDASHISRICTGKRNPSDPEGFLEDLSCYLEANYNTASSRDIIASLLGTTCEDLMESRQFRDRLCIWLCQEDSPDQDSAQVFLQKLDSFNLDEYIRAIRFDELRVPTVPFSLPHSRNYFGLEEMKRGELDFLKTMVMSKSTENVFMCSDMEMEDMAADNDFAKKWMFGLAMMLRKGLHLSIIHNLDRPFQEMMLGLESWIPLYMTGLISPYYFKAPQNKVYNHLTYVAGTVALIGEGVAGFHAESKYYLTNNREEVAFYRKKADFLLQKAYPLMDIYRVDTLSGFHAFLEADSHVPGPRRNILTSPPLYTMQKEFLEKILRRNGIEEKDILKITEYASQKYSQICNILENCSLEDEVLLPPREEFEKFPAVLSLSELFYEKEVKYSYEEYCEHIEMTRAFAKTHPNYRLSLSQEHIFRNINISIHFGKWVIVSKSQYPCVHFVIRHPKLRNALENITAAVVDH